MFTCLWAKDCVNVFHDTHTHTRNPSCTSTTRFVHKRRPIRTSHFTVLHQLYASSSDKGTQAPLSLFCGSLGGGRERGREREMERKALVLCSVVGLLGLLSVATGFGAEATRIKVKCFFFFSFQLFILLFAGLLSNIMTPAGIVLFKSIYTYNWQCLYWFSITVIGFCIYSLGFIESPLIL